KDEPRETEDEYTTAGPGEAGDHGTQTLSREAFERVPVTAHASPPALTPFLFALSGMFIALGLVFTKWLVIVGALIIATVTLAGMSERGARRAAAHHDAHEDEGHGQDTGTHEAHAPETAATPD